MPLKFNPLSSTFDLVGSGGGTSYIDGEVQNFSALPETVGTPPVDSAYLVREAEGTWLINRKPAGIYIRTANTGTRASDWTHAGAFPDVFNDANFLLYDAADSTKNLAFQLSGITTGTTRTLTAPDASGEISLTSHTHELADLDSSGIAAGKFLQADGNDGAQWDDVTDADVPISAATASGFPDGNGIYYPISVTLNSRRVFKLNKTYGMFFEASKWHIFENVPITANILYSSNTTTSNDPWGNTWADGDVDQTVLADSVAAFADQFGFVGDDIPSTSVTGLGTAAASDTGDFAAASHTHTAADIDSGASAADTFLQSNGSGGAGWNTVSYDDLDDVPSNFTPSTHASSHATGGSDAIAPSDIGAANASHTHAASDITSGTLTHERGGLEADVSAYDGLLKISGGSTSAVTVTTAGEALLDDADAAAQRTTLGLGTAATVSADQDLNTTDAVSFSSMTAESFSVYNATDGFSVELDASGGLGDDRTLSLPDASGTIALTSDIPDPSSATPQALGTAAAGTSDDYSRADHIHAAPALNDLSNVSAAAPNDNDVLVFDNATSTWVAEAPAASGIAETLLDAKGDLIVASAADTAARLAVGSNGHVLTADSGETTGIKWAALPAGGTKTYAVFTPDSNQPPASNYAVLDTRNSVACLDFDDATDESAVFVGIIPEGASLGSGLKIRIHWAATTATSGDCVWLAALERINTDLDSDSFDTAGTVTTTCNGTSGIVAVSEITLTNIDSVTAGDGFRLKITRDADSGSDTLSGDAELVLCEVRSAA